jgi:hypothetical protein
VQAVKDGQVAAKKSEIGKIGRKEKKTPIKDKRLRGYHSNYEGTPPAGLLIDNEES